MRLRYVARGGHKVVGVALNTEVTQVHAYSCMVPIRSAWECGGCVSAGLARANGGRRESRSRSSSEANKCVLGANVRA